eukprot:scaffold297363_cov18-Tisochrysis_lutea.AAC.1
MMNDKAAFMVGSMDVGLFHWHKRHRVLPTIKKRSAYQSRVVHWGKKQIVAIRNKDLLHQTRFASEWEKTVTRLGRWIDFKNDYKTLDPSFMESV